MARTDARSTKAPRKKAKRAAPKSAAANVKPAPLGAKAVQALKRAEEIVWGSGATPHRMLQELHESLLLRCLEEAGGNYAAAAALFGPSRQSVQQYANSPLRDERWRPYQQNRRKKRGE